jgi:hypothetical protein
MVNESDNFYPGLDIVIRMPPEAGENTVLREGCTAAVASYLN